MGLIAEFRTPASTFAVGRAIDDDPDLTVELERVVPTDETMVPFFWAWGGDLEGFEERLQVEEAIRIDRPLARTERGALYRVEWTGALSEVVRGLFDLEFTLLSGEADAERWRFEIRFEDPEAATEFQSYLVEHGITHQLIRVQGLADLAPRSALGLTEKQHEALLEAHEGGYFSVPREMTVGELADRLGIASSSASDRLRRAIDRLVEETVVPERELRLATEEPTSPDWG